MSKCFRSLFDSLSQMQMSNIQFGLEVEYVEIFNDEIRDLLSDNLSSVYLDEAGLAGAGEVRPEMSARLSSRRALLASVLKSVTVFALVRPPTENQILTLNTFLSLTKI